MGEEQTGRGEEFSLTSHNPTPRAEVGRQNKAILKITQVFPVLPEYICRAHPWKYMCLYEYVCVRMYECLKKLSDMHLF